MKEKEKEREKRKNKNKNKKNEKKKNKNKNKNKKNKKKNKNKNKKNKNKNKNKKKKTKMLGHESVKIAEDKKKEFKKLLLELCISTIFSFHVREKKKKNVMAFIEKLTICFFCTVSIKVDC